MTFLLIVGFLFNMASSVHPAFFLLGGASLLSGFLMAQSALNQHCRRHLTGPLPATVAQESSLGDFLGARGPSLALGPAAAFLVAWLLSDLLSSLLPIFESGPLPPAGVWGRMIINAVLLSALVAASFRLVASDFTAALLASLAYALLVTTLRILVFHTAGPDFRDRAVLAVFTLLWPMLLLFGLAVTLRVIRPAWLAIWIAALASFLLAMIADNLLGGLVFSSASDFFPPWQAVLTELASATVFAFTFWGGARLMQSVALNTPKASS